MTATSSPAGLLDGIDHTLIGVADLDRAREVWRRLGFVATPRGRHIGWTTGNVCLMFERDYVELLGILDPAGFVNGLDVFLERRGEGLLGVALSTPDAEALHARAGQGEGGGEAGGLTEPPKDLSRLFDRPEGTVEPRFKLVHFTPGATPGLSSFVCQHLTPGLLRRPDWLDHPNGAVALDGVTVVAEDPAALAPAYARLFGREALRGGRGLLEVRTGRHALRFLDPARFARRYPGAVPPAEPPVAAVMTVAVRDLGHTAALLAREGIATLRVPGERVVVPADLASGTILEFAAS